MIKQDYKERDRRHLPPFSRGAFMDIGALVTAILIVVAVGVLVLSTVCSVARAQTPQDGYDSLNMAPRGMYWSNPAQGYSEPIQERYGPSRSYEWGFQPDRPPTYYNEWGQPSTVPDPRQYWDVEGVQM